MDFAGVCGKLTTMIKKDPLANKRVLVIGFGRQGKALARWLPKIGAAVVVNDSSSEESLKLNRKDYPNVHFILGEHPETALDGIHLICVSGGVSLEMPLLLAARERGIPITNDA